MLKFYNLILYYYTMQSKPDLHLYNDIQRLGLRMLELVAAMVAAWAVAVWAAAAREVAAWAVAVWAAAAMVEKTGCNDKRIRNQELHTTSKRRDHGKRCDSANSADSSLQDFRPRRRDAI